MVVSPYRTAIVTGASRGIGAATVRRLRREGLGGPARGRRRDGRREHARGAELPGRNGARPAWQRRASQRDRAGPRRNRRASQPDGRPEEGGRRFYEGCESLLAEGIAQAIAFVLSAPQGMDVSFMKIVPTDQSYGGSAFHRRGAA
jgi:NADP-dependent 3-hydroxy acid dehydrogenase YdfG